MSKDIVKNWKSQVAKEAATTTTTTTVKAEAVKSTTSLTTTTSTTAASSSHPSINTKPLPAQLQNTSRDASPSSSPRTPTDTPRDRTVKSDGVRIRSTGNDTRDRCIEMLYQALGTNSNAGKYICFCVFNKNWSKIKCSSMPQAFSVSSNSKRFISAYRHHFRIGTSVEEGNQH